VVVGALADGDLIDGKYRIVRFIGRGAWASVYEGVNSRIGRRVAIKVLSDDALKNPGVVERFEREAQAATRIDSEHVVHVFDLGVLGDGRPYIVMELLEGEDLAHKLASKGPLPEQAVAFYGVQACRGLGEAHAAGVIHRDIKPDNIVLVKTKSGDEAVKIVDFGISKLHSNVQPSSITQTNAVLGSPVYMSPEQCRGTKQMDHRSDLYSLGVVLFELLTGQFPHKADSFNELMFKIALEDAKSPRTFRPGLDPDLSTIIEKALARDAKERFQSAASFEDALFKWAKARGHEPESWIGRKGKLRSSVDEDPPAIDASQPKQTIIDSSRPSEAVRLLSDSQRGSGERIVAGAATVLDTRESPGLLTTTAASQRKRRTIIAAAGGAVAVLVATLIIVFVFVGRGNRGASTTTQGSAASASTITPETTTATATQSAPTATIVATDTASSTPSASASASAGTRTTGRYPVAPGTTAAPTATADPTAPTTATSTAPASSKSTVGGRTINTAF
jgi:serine/threonine-protein kinase